MKIDVVIVTYNSEKWINNNINSIINSNFNLKNVSLICYDNNSTDETVKLLNENKKKYELKFNKFIVLSSKKNFGFGISNNKAAKLSTSDYIFFLNADTEIEKDTFIKLEKEVSNCEKDVAVWELRQKPYEHPKYYDPITGYTSWASGACLIIKRKIFEKINGFDKNIFMYCEDVDLCWRIRQHGYKIKYLYFVPINHYSYVSPNDFKEKQFVYSIVNNLYLRCKYGNLKDVVRGYSILLRAYIRNLSNGNLSDIEYTKIKKLIKKAYFKMLFPRIYARIFKHFHWIYTNINPTFIYTDYEVAKLDPYYAIDTSTTDKPLVSIIVRTCNRPQILRETLVSLKNQTYNNFEVIVVEDGKDTSESMIKHEFNNINLKYFSTGSKVGRSRAGNIGLSKASGKYFNFLDDDDVFYPDHIEVLVNEMENNNWDIAYDTAFETKIEVKSTNPYIYSIKDKYILYYGHYSRIKLARGNITPIQSVMFKKSVYDKLGGFDEKMDSLEDWDLWLKYSAYFNFNHILKTTSIYRVPYEKKKNRIRQKFLDNQLEYLFNKHFHDNIKITYSDIFWADHEKNIK